MVRKKSRFFKYSINCRIKFAGKIKSGVKLFLCVLSKLVLSEIVKEFFNAIWLIVL